MAKLAQTRGLGNSKVPETAFGVGSRQTSRPLPSPRRQLATCLLLRFSCSASQLQAPSLAALVDLFAVVAPKQTDIRG